MRRWIKLHTDILDDPTIGRLSWMEKGVWLFPLPLAGRIEDYDAAGELTGRLDTLDNVAWHLRSRPEDLIPVIERLIQVGLLECDADGVLYIPDFAASQAPDTSAERMQRYRQRRRARTAASQPRDANVTPPLRECDVTVTPALRERDATVTPTSHAPETSVTPASHERYASVTAALRDVAESEQNRIRTEQNQNNIQNRTEQQQSRTDLEQPAVAAVDNSLMNHSVVNRAYELHGVANRAEELSAVTNDLEGPSVLADGSAQQRGITATVTAQAPEGHVAAPDDTPAALPQAAAAGEEDVAPAERPPALPREPDGAWEAERTQVRDRLMALGVNAATAEQLAQTHPPEYLREWCDRMCQQRRPGDPTGAVIPRIARDHSAPQRRHPDATAESAGDADPHARASSAHAPAPRDADPFPE